MFWNNKVIQEMETLTLATIDINNHNFKEWEWEQILEWILSCDDGRFKRYEEKLRKNLQQEEVSGVDLKDVNEVDIKRWGVTKFSDIKTLCSNIQELVNQN